MNYGIITVDTEGHDGKDPINNLIWGKQKDGENLGIDLIMDIAEEFGTKALFFVDFAEAWDYGKEKVAEVVKHIEDRGHNVGVHIHPDHMADKKRLFLWEYSKKEQIEIITKCTELYVELLGHKPNSFRAGKYSANSDTLDIINELGYKYDFSEFMGQKWCGINPPITADKPCIYKNLIEFPVTVFKSAETPIFRRYDKLDMEMVESQFSYVVMKYNELNGNVISLFLHSFSFLKWRKDPDNPVIWKKNIKKCRKSLSLVKKLKNFELVAETDIEHLLKNNTLCIGEGNREPSIKVTNVIYAYYFLLTTSFRIFEHNRKARVFVIFNIIVLLVAFTLALAVLLG